MKPKKPDKRTKAEILKSEEKWKQISIVAITLLLFLPALILTMKASPPPCPECDPDIIVTENFCLNLYAHLRNTTGSTEYFWAEYKVNIDGPAKETIPTTSLDQLTTDVRNLYLNSKITIDQYHCLLAGIKGHEIKGK